MGNFSGKRVRLFLRSELLNSYPLNASEPPFKRNRFGLRLGLVTAFPLFLVCRVFVVAAEIDIIRAGKTKSLFKTSLRSYSFEEPQEELPRQFVESVLVLRLVARVIPVCVVKIYEEIQERIRRGEVCKSIDDRSIIPNRCVERHCKLHNLQIQSGSQSTHCESVGEYVQLDLPQSTR